MNTPYHSGHKPTNDKSLGQALVEFSLILPILLIVILGIIDFGRILLIFSNVSSSARDAARQATLVGNFTDAQMGNVPRYMACANIDTLAGNFFGAARNTPDSVVNSVDILYFDTSGDTTPLATVEANLAALDPRVLGTLDTADYDCDLTNSRANNPDIERGRLTTGDLMVVLVDIEIEFITPFVDLLTAFFDSESADTLNLSFRAQRTLVDSLVLDISGDDRDGDGLLDFWEYGRFGCVLEGSSPNDVALNPLDSSLMMNIPGGGWSYVDPAGYTLGQPPTPYTPPPGAPVASSYSVPGDCDRVNLPANAFDDPSQYAYLDCQTTNPPVFGNCINVALDLFNALDDPDNDGCVNGCEQQRQTAPLDYIGNFTGNDTDGDGISDLAELGVENGGTDPNNWDTDGDGIPDGVERCEIESDDGLTCLTSPASGPWASIWNGQWTDTDPTRADSDGDGIDDDEELDVAVAGGLTDPRNPDTDGDAIVDGEEVNGFRLPYDLIIDGVTFTSAQIGLVYTDPTSDDTDGDGIPDGTEISGYYIENDIDGRIFIRTHPNDADTDNDGLCDGPGTAGTNALGTQCSGIADINPLESDTDKDGLNDYQELIEYGTLADNDNSDGNLEVCVDFNGNPQPGLTDGFEMIDVPDTDVDGDGVVNALDLDSDGDGLTDCDEQYIYGTDPYNPDTDGDTSVNPLWTDGYEVAAFCLNAQIPNVAGDELACDEASENEDTDFDGIPDAWEALYYLGDLSNDEFSDTDGDDCDLACEYLRQTDPTNFDTDGDGIRDGWEIGTSPLGSDRDNDGLIDGREGRDPVTGECVDPDALDLIGRARDDCFYSSPINADTDRDGLLDANEITFGTDPINPDSDGDGLLDGQEVNGFTLDIQVRTAASNGNLVPYTNPTTGTTSIATNPLNPDTDGDGLSDFAELFFHNTDPFNSDTDGDGIPDGTTPTTQGELSNGADPLTYPGYGTNPLWHDTDRDGLSDWQEIFPNLSNATYAALWPYEVTYEDENGNDITETRNPAGFDPSTPFNVNRLSPLNDDTDGDGLSDGEEMNLYDTDPLDLDTDDDGIEDGDEIDGGTDPLAYDAGGPGPDPDPGTDTDGDGLLDSWEDSPDPAIIEYQIRDVLGSLPPVRAVTLAPNLLSTEADTDGDGLLDSYELFWHSPNHPDLNGFDFSTAGEGASCDYLANYPDGDLPVPFIDDQPLDPIRFDTDGDGLGDGFECNPPAILDDVVAALQLNPFDGSTSPDVLAPVTNSALREAILLAVSGDYEGAYNILVGIGETVYADGRIDLTFERVDRKFIGDAITPLTIGSMCSPAYEDDGLVANACAVYINGGETSTEPDNRNDNPSTQDNNVTIRITPAAVYYLLAHDLLDTTRESNRVIVEVTR